MKINLSPTGAFWSLPGTPVVLTLGQRECDVNIGTLNDLQYRQLLLAVNRGIVVTEEVLVERVALKQPVYVEDTSRGLVDFKVEAVEMLNGTVPQIRKRLTQITDVRLAKIAAELESQGKKRSRVLTMLDSRIAQFHNEISNSIASHSGGHPVSGRQLDALAEAFVVEEFEDEEETVDVPVSGDAAV